MRSYIWWYPIDPSGSVYVTSFFLLSQWILAIVLSSDLLIIFSFCWNLLLNFCSDFFILYNFFFLKDLFIFWQRERMSRDGGVEEEERENFKQTPCWAWHPTWGSIPQPWHCDPSRNQELDRQSHPGVPMTKTFVQIRIGKQKHLKTDGLHDSLDFPKYAMTFLIFRSFQLRIFSASNEPPLPHRILSKLQNPAQLVPAQGNHYPPPPGKAGPFHPLPPVRLVCASVVDVLLHHPGVSISISGTSWQESLLVRSLRTGLGCFP